MASNLMDTEPGGESTQYESIKTTDVPHAKEPGQLGANDPTTNKTAPPHTTLSSNNPYKDTTSNAPRINDMGGKTNTSTGAADAEEEGEGEAEAEKSRRVQGYGGSNDMRRDVGA